jgi:hypothetical protein
MKFLHASASLVIAAAVSLGSTTAHADDVHGREDPHERNISPEASAGGVQPGTTQGMARGATLPQPAGARALGAGAPLVGTTTTTGATFGSSATADVAPAGQVRPNRAVLAAGLSIFAASYLSSVAVAATSDRYGDERLFVPVVGPWLNLGDRGCHLQACPNEGVNNALLVTSGVAQAGGLVLTLISLGLPRRDEGPRESAGPSVRVLPGSVGRGGAGAFAVGTF